MEKKAVVFGLLAASLVFGGEKEEQRQIQSSSDSCCLDPCCGCSYKPEKCIDCECFVPRYYDSGCWGFSIQGEFLYWYARESHLSYACDILIKPAADVTPPFNPSNRMAAFPVAYKYFGTDWEPGFRIGAGASNGCTGWDFLLNWTYYRNTRKDRSSVPQFTGEVPNVGERGLIDPWNNMAFIATPVWDKVKARWSLRLNQIDLEFGYKYCLGQSFTLRPYAGVRGAWTDTNFTVTAILGPKPPENDPTLSLISEFERDRVKADQWGVGLLVGLQPNWILCGGFGLYSNLSAALLWGRYKADDTRKIFREETNTAGEVAIVFNQQNTAKNNFTKMQAILDLGIGIQWERGWCCDRFRSTLDLGWEHHVWFDYSSRYLLGDHSEGEGTSLFKSYLDLPTQLMFGGLVVRLKFDF